MSNTTMSPNMGLVIPTVGVDPGPDWANNINNSLNIIDGHNHTIGNGVQIPAGGINLASDLPFNDNNAILLRSTRFQVQGSALSGGSDLGCLYVTGVDLYFNDENGNQVRITQSGNVAGTPGSIGSLTSPASASYVSADQTFVWQSNTNTPANLDAGSVIFRNITASSNGITVNAPAALGSNYSLTWPAIPAQTNVMTLDNSGNMGSTTWDQVGVNMTSVGANAIAASRTRTTGTSVGIGGVAISASCGAFSTSSSSPVMVTNLEVSIVSSGRPIMVQLVPDNAITGLSFIGVAASGATSQIRMYLIRGVTTIAYNELENNVGGASGITTLIPPSLSQIDVVSAGTYVYQVQISLQAGVTAFVQYCKLIAYEL